MNPSKLVQSSFVPFLSLSFLFLSEYIDCDFEFTSSRRKGNKYLILRVKLLYGRKQSNCNDMLDLNER